MGMVIRLLLVHDLDLVRCVLSRGLDHVADDQDHDAPEEGPRRGVGVARGRQGERAEDQQDP